MPNILKSALVAGLISSNPVFADTKTEVLSAVNEALQNGNHSIAIGNARNLEISAGGLRYTFNEENRTGCQRFNAEFDNSAGEAGLGICLSTDITSHRLSYPAFQNDNIEFRIGGEMTEYDNLTLSAQAQVSHRDFGDYSGEISERVGNTLHDLSIYASLEAEYPLGENTTLNASAEGSYGLFTYDASLEVGLTQNFGNLSFTGALGVETFGIRDQEPESRLADTLLGGTTSYVQIGTEYCPIDKVCANANIYHGLGGAGKGDTSLRLGLSAKF